MLYSGPAQLRSVEPLLLLVEELAVQIARQWRRRPPAPRRARGAVLKPGADTPHWLAMVELVRPHLRRRGAKALLARELGLNKGRVTQFFSRPSAMPDAERTLLLLTWMRRQPRSGAPTKLLIKNFGSAAEAPRKRRGAAVEALRVARGKVAH